MRPVIVSTAAFLRRTFGLPPAGELLVQLAKALSTYRQEEDYVAHVCWPQLANGARLGGASDWAALLLQVTEQLFMVVVVVPAEEAAERRGGDRYVD